MRRLGVRGTLLQRLHSALICLAKPCRAGGSHSSQRFSQIRRRSERATRKLHRKIRTGSSSASARWALGSRLPSSDRVIDKLRSSPPDTVPRTTLPAFASRMCSKVIVSGALSYTMWWMIRRITGKCGRMWSRLTLSRHQNSLKSRQNTLVFWICVRMRQHSPN